MVIVFKFLDMWTVKECGKTDSSVTNSKENYTIQGFLATKKLFGNQEEFLPY